MDDVSAAFVMLYHRVTGCPVMAGKQYLQKLSPTQRARVFKSLQVARENGNYVLRDPIEDTPQLREIFKAVCLQATQETDTWHNKELKELEKTSPSVADLMRSGRGLCHIKWQTMKRILEDNHGIEWMTPVEMNPYIIFD